jgi:hypothetical protein
MKTKAEKILTINTIESLFLTTNDWTKGGGVIQYFIVARLAIEMPRDQNRI